MDATPPTPPPPPPPPRIEVAAKPDRTWDVLCHLSALAMYAFPFGHILGPLIVWLVKRDSLPSVDAHGKESLNFQLSLTLYLMVAAGVTISLCFILIGLLLVPLLFLAAVLFPVLDLIMVIIAAVKAGNGELFRYPLTVRFIK